MPKAPTLTNPTGGPLTSLSEVDDAIVVALGGRDVLSATDDEQDNLLRARFSLSAVRAFATTTGLRDADGIETMISDLLADLRHLCDTVGIEIDDLLRLGKLHYDDEVADFRGGWQRKSNDRWEWVGAGSPAARVPPPDRS